MSSTIIDRSNFRFEEEDFLKLHQLHKDHEWLDEEPSALFNLWRILENEEQKKLIEALIKNFTFVDGKSLNQIGKILSSHIEKVWGLTPQSTYIVATCDDSKPDGSQSILQSIKNKFTPPHWSEKNFINSLPVAANEIKDNKTIVLIDDFIGTGDTIKRKYKYLTDTLEKREIKNTTIKIVTLAAMNFSKEALDSLGVEYFSHLWLKKGIAELIDEAERESASSSMELLENKLKEKYGKRKLSSFLFGYKRSESLFALQANNIPNNVFPIFWWPYLKDGTLRRTLFRRS